MDAQTDRHRGTVHIIDDDPAMREALAFSLRNAGYEIRAYESPPPLMPAGLDGRPGVILLDVRLQAASGVRVHAHWLQQGLHTPVIFMSGQSQPHEIVESFRQGAVHFLIKPFTTAALLAIVKEAMDREARRLERKARSDRLREVVALLTPREREVCRLMLKGYPNRDIAAAHGTVPGTVKLQRARVLEKLGVGSMAELAGLFEGEHPEELLLSPPDRPPEGAA